jgi:hypothetical protein
MLRRVYWPVILLVCAIEVEAQTSERLALTAAINVGTHHPSYSPLSAPGVWGATVGAEAILTERMMARAATTYLRSASTRDDLSICIAPEPPWELGTNCYEPNYAAWYGLLSTELLVRPKWSGPMYAMGGAGWTIVSSQAYAWGTSPTAGLPSGRGVWRFGGGLVLGRSKRAPRLEFATIRFAGRIGDARSVTTLQLWMR